MAVSSKSLSGLQGDLKISNASPVKPALHLRLSPEALVAIRQGKGKITFTDGDQPILHVGQTPYKLSSSQETTAPELYTHKRKTNTLELSGKLYRRLQPDRSLSDGDAIQERLRERNAELQQAKESQRTVSLSSFHLSTGKVPSMKRSSSSSPGPAKRIQPGASPNKSRQPNRLVADHIPQRPQSSQGLQHEHTMNYSIHAQKAPNKDATSSMPLSTTHSTAPPAASVAAQDLQNAAVSDSGSTSSSHGDAASMFSSSRISSSNTSVSSADSPPAKLELNGQQLTVNPALLMRAPSTSSHPLPQKPVAAQAPSGPPSQPSASSKGGGGGLVKGKESAKKDKKKSETKYKSAAIIEDEESDFEPQSKAANKRKSAPSTGSSSQPTASKRPKPQPKTKATIEKGSSSGRDSSSKAPRIESRTAGGARICGKPSPKPSNTPAPSSSAVPSPAGTDEAPSKKRKIPEPVAKDKSSAANKKVKREAVYYTSTEDEDEDADGEVDDSFMTSTQQPTDRGRPGEVKRTHLSKSSAAASLHEKNHKPSSKNASPDGSKVAAADANIAVSNPYTNHQEYAEARATFVKQYEDYEAMRRKLEMKQGILRRLLRGDDLSNDERIQIPSKREVTNMVAEATERRSKLAETKQHLWAFARVHKSQHS